MRVGIIGCGKIAQVRHIPEYLARNDVEIAGFYDWNGDRTGELVGQYGGYAYASEDELQEVEGIGLKTAQSIRHVLDSKYLYFKKEIKEKKLL